jgi:hypothetical protein
MILLNHRSLKEGKSTNDVLITYELWKSLLRINDQYYTNDAKFQLSIDGESKSYRLHHLTNADLQLFITLFKVCNSNGNLRNINRHVLYKAHCMYHEEPISAQQFYVSYEKLRLHNIFIVNKDVLTNDITLTLAGFLNVNTKKPERYVAVPALVFTKEFNQLSLAAKILFFDIYMQQSKKAPVLRRTEDNLYFMLHKSKPHHLRDVFEELTTTKMRNKQPLFSLAEKESRNKVYRFSVHKSLHKSLHSKSSKVEDNYREPIEAPLIYKRKASFIQNVLTEFGIGELKQDLALLVNCLKKANYRVIRHALYEIKKFKDENSRFPKDLARTIVKEIRLASSNVILDLARKRECIDFVAPGLKGTERKDRFFEFTSFMSKHFSFKQMDKVFKNIQPLLSKTYKEKYVPARTDYRGLPILDVVIGIEDVRTAAWEKQVSVESYEELEKEVYRIHSIRNTDIQLRDKSRNICTWLSAEIDELVRQNKTPYVPLDFRIEDFIKTSMGLV